MLAESLADDADGAPADDARAEMGRARRAAPARKSKNAIGFAASRAAPGGGGGAPMARAAQTGAAIPVVKREELPPRLRFAYLRLAGAD